MASLYKRTTILTVCRLLNQCMTVISPVILVRILDMESYGQYREFLLYVMLLASFIAMGIRGNLLYFIPKSPQNEARYVTNTTVMLFVSYGVGAVLIWLFRGVIVAKTSFDFTLPLIVYLFFFVNLDFLNSFWLAHKRADVVMYYTLTTVMLRVSVVVVVAYVFRDVSVIIWSMVAVGAAKFAFCLVFLLRKRLLKPYVDWPSLKKQLVFVVPLGIGAVILHFNRQIGQFLISARMGAEALALFSIGCTQVPVMAIVRQSLSDVVFPELVERNKKDTAAGIRLWKKANVMYCFFVFPLFTVLLFFAEPLIEFAFTAEYLPAAPVFRIYLLLMVRQCFEMGSPLRALNQNKHFVMGNVLALALNLGLIVVLFKYIGFLGPAIAFVAADVGMALYLGFRIIKGYEISMSRLFYWKKILTIAGCCILPLPVLLTGPYLPLSGIQSAAVLGAVFFVAYYTLIRLVKVEEVETLWARLTRRLR